MELELLRDQCNTNPDKMLGGIEYEGSEKESDCSEEDDYVDDIPLEELKKKTNMRTSVSSEAYGLYNKKGDFKPPNYPKSPEIEQQIKSRLNQAFMFSALKEEELQLVIGAMQGVKKKAGEVVIREGDDGDNLYVLESGTL